VPEGPFAPADGEVVRQTQVAFEWPGAPGCDLYHLQVSRRADMLTIYRPDFDCYHAEPRFEAPFGGIFNPGESYYWRVRARSEAGVWSPWSEVRRFEWRGPCPPVNVRSEVDGPRVRIRWEPNPDGARPVRYLVYGSDERGFTVADGPHEVVGRGEVPGNLLREANGTEMLVVAPEAADGRMNRCFYRVVAVDERGTRSGCSDYAEMPHPLIFTEPVAEARAGEAYRYEAQSLRSLGDLQYRDRQRPHEYFVREEVAWALVDGPQWLAMDADTGVLSGTPAAPGRYEVAISATASCPHDYFSTGRSQRFFKAAQPKPVTVTQRFDLEVR